MNTKLSVWSSALLVLFSGLSLLASPVYADRTELSDGRYVDEFGAIHNNKYENEDIFAPWNDPMLKDDPFAPWNDPMLEDDFMAPWNDPMADERETNMYLRENGVRDSEYYWE